MKAQNRSRASYLVSAMPMAVVKDFSPHRALADKPDASVVIAPRGRVSQYGAEYGRAEAAALIRTGGAKHEPVVHNWMTPALPSLQSAAVSTSVSFALVSAHPGRSGLPVINRAPRSYVKYDHAH